MDQVKLGAQGAAVSRMGLGCMGMSEFYGPRDDRESAATILRALDLGITMLDTADVYGVGDNEELVGKTIQGRRDQVFLATKFGNVRSKNEPINGDRTGVPNTSARPATRRSDAWASITLISTTSTEWTQPPP